jgi:hypothetical protein
MRTVRVHYKTSDAQASPEVSEPMRCDAVWRGYLGRCTRPSQWTVAQQNDIKTRLASAGSGLSPDQIEVYAGFCSKECYDETLYSSGGWYEASGVRAIRQALTDVDTPEEIPTWCGGRSLGSQGLF